MAHATMFEKSHGHDDVFHRVKGTPKDRHVKVVVSSSAGSAEEGFLVRKFAREGFLFTIEGEDYDYTVTSVIG